MHTNQPLSLASTYWRNWNLILLRVDVPQTRAWLGNSALFLSDFDETLASDVVWGPEKIYERNFENRLRHSPRQNFVACPSLRDTSPLFVKIERRVIPRCMRLHKGYRMINCPRVFVVLQRKLPYKNCLSYRNPDGLFYWKVSTFALS
jgi:hypothetical protein